MVSCPGYFTPSEGFAALKAGAHALKLFPAEGATPAVIKAQSKQEIHHWVYSSLPLDKTTLKRVPPTTSLAGTCSDKRCCRSGASEWAERRPEAAPPVQSTEMCTSDALRVRVRLRRGRVPRSALGRS